MINLRYPYTYEVDKHDDGNDLFFVSCPLVPEPLATGATLKAAKADLIGLLLITAGVYRKEGRLFPVPAGCPEPTVELNYCQSLKIHLLNAMTETGAKPIDIAKRLDLPRQRLTPLLDPKVASRLDVVLSAIEATGKELTLKIT